MIFKQWDDANSGVNKQTIRLLQALVIINGIVAFTVAAAGLKLVFDRRYYVRLPTTH